MQPINVLGGKKRVRDIKTHYISKLDKLMLRSLSNPTLYTKEPLQFGWFGDPKVPVVALNLRIKQASCSLIYEQAPQNDIGRLLHDIIATALSDVGRLKLMSLALI